MTGSTRQAYSVRQMRPHSAGRPSTVDGIASHIIVPWIVERLGRGHPSSRLICHSRKRLVASLSKKGTRPFVGLGGADFLSVTSLPITPITALTDSHWCLMDCGCEGRVERPANPPLLSKTPGNIPSFI